MIYVYAITDRPELPVPGGPGLEGLGGHESCPYPLPHREIAAVVCSLPMAELQVTEANLWKHEAVVEALLADRAVLPVRFGTALADEAAVQAMLATRHAGLVADLDRVRGRVELGLRVLWNDKEQEQDGDPQREAALPLPPAITYPPLLTHSRPPANSGQAYLLARLEEERRLQARRREAEMLAAEIHAPLARLAADAVREVLLAPRLLLTAAYLVEQEQVAAFQHEVEKLGQLDPSLRFLCTGPWPAYSFVTASMKIPVGRQEDRHV